MNTVNIYFILSPAYVGQSVYNWSQETGPFTTLGEAQAHITTNNLKNIRVVKRPSR